MHSHLIKIYLTETIFSFNQNPMVLTDGVNQNHFQMIDKIYSKINFIYFLILRENVHINTKLVIYYNFFKKFNSFQITWYLRSSLLTAIYQGNVVYNIAGSTMVLVNNYLMHMVNMSYNGIL